MLKLTVLMPVHDERYSVEEAIRRVLAVRLPEAIRLELLVVDDGSTDGSGEILRRLADSCDEIRLIRHERNLGKGAAVRTGVQEASGDVIAVHDADLEYDPEELPRLLAPILEGHADVVYGSRFLVREHKRVLFFWHCVGNRFLTTLSNAFTNLDLTDMGTCHKMAKASILKSIPIRSNRFGVEAELTAKFAKRGCRIYEIPVSYHGRTYREGKKARWWDGLLTLLTILKYWVIDDIYDEKYGHDILFKLSRAHRFNRWMAEKIRPYVGDHVLEIGAGLGNLTLQLLPRESYLVTDTDDLHLEYLRNFFSNQRRVDVQRVDLALPADFAGLKGRFDTVVCLNVLEHVKNDGPALRNLHDALRPGGRACLLVPAGEKLFGSLDEVLGHHRRYTEQGLRDLVTSCGFEIEKLSGFNRVSVPAWFLNARLLKRTTFSRLQLKIFDSLIWLWRWIDPLLPWKGISLVVIARRP